jgi:hypothetical protein
MDLDAAVPNYPNDPSILGELSADVQAIMEQGEEEAVSLFHQPSFLRSVNEQLEEDQVDDRMSLSDLKLFADPGAILDEGVHDGSIFAKPGSLRREAGGEDIVYTPNPTPLKYHHDNDSRIKALMSGVGIGKTSAMAIELVRLAQRQAPDRHGVRYTKFAVIRSTYAQLKTTTLPTFLEWLPPQSVKIVYGSPITVLMQMRLRDGTTVHAQFLFFPLDRPAQVANLLSLEITGAAINEAAEIKLPAIIKVLLSRCRYPRGATAPITWKGILLDYNPPPIGSWLYKMFEENSNPRYKLYKYPPAVLIRRDESDPENPKLWQFEPNPEAENVQHVADGMKYWLDLAEDYRYDWPMLQRFVLGQYTYGGQGRPVHHAFSERRHIVKDNRSAYRTVPLIIGFDFGLYTAAAITQQQERRVMLLDLFAEPESGLEEFLDDILMPILNSRYAGVPRIATGDPAGRARSPIDKARCISYLKKRGFEYKTCPSNAIPVRLEAVNHALRTEGRFGVNARCTDAITALSGGYHWDTSKEHLGITTDKPAKNDASHGMDALQYAMMYYHRGAGREYGTNAAEFPHQRRGGRKRGRVGLKPGRQLPQGGWPNA